MDNTYLDFLLAVAAIVAPLGLAGLLVELRSRPKSRFGNSGHRDGFNCGIMKPESTRDGQKTR
jgi:hypothetical protein